MRYHSQENVYLSTTKNKQLSLPEHHEYLFAANKSNIACLNIISNILWPTKNESNLA